MNKKNKKIVSFLGSLGLLVGIITTIITPMIISKNEANVLNNNVKIANNSDHEITSNLNNQKAAETGDFLLNDQNAIELQNNIENKSAYSVTNGPRGFVSVQNNKITYTSFDGNVLGASIDIVVGTNSLVAMEYNAYSSCFLAVISYKANGGYLEVVSIRENDFSVVKSEVITFDNTKRDLNNIILAPITSNEITDYFIFIQYQSIYNSNQMTAYNISFDDLKVSGGKVGKFIKFDMRFNDMYQGQVIVSAGAYSLHSAFREGVYVMFLIYNIDDLSFKFRIYRTYGPKFDALLAFLPDTLFSNNTTATWEDIVNNGIKSIYIEAATHGLSEETCNVYVFFNNNLETENIKVMKWRADFRFTGNSPNPSYMNAALIGSWVFDDKKNYRYEINQGKFYGGYLYAYVNYKNLANNSIFVPKIMRLNFKDITNQNQLIWKDNYNNNIINLWDVPYKVIDNSIPIVLPINSSQKSNIITFLNNKKNYWLIDGTKNAFAYSTMLNTANTNNIFVIEGVSDIFVKDANKELATYFSDKLLEKSFTQFQKGSKYTISKKPNELAENYKGNIPAILTINSGYNNDSYLASSQTFEIVLSGFYNEAKTWIYPSIVPIALDTFPYQEVNPNSDNIKAFIYENIIMGAYKANLTTNNIIDVQLNSQPYNNKEGKLILDSITLNKWYDEQGIEQNTPKIFKLINDAPIVIQGFKQIKSYTNLKTRSLPVDGLLSSMTTTQISQASNKNNLLQWINVNKNLLLDNLPVESNVVDVNINSTISSSGAIEISVTIDKFFANDNLFTYEVQRKEFGNIVLTNFLAHDLTTTTTKQPLKNVEGSLVNLFPSEITSNNTDFKQFLFDNVIVDPTDTLNVTNVTSFTGIANNSLGQYELTSISLDEAYNRDGISIGAKTFNHLSYIIRGFKSNNLETIINANPQEPLPESFKNILAQKVSISISEFKAYIFNYVLIDRTNPKLLQETVIDSNSIVDPIYDNLNGTIKFKLRITNTVDINGSLTGQPKTFDEIITISGFRTILPTSLKADSTIYNAGNINVWGNDVLDTTYEPIIRNNFNSILTNLPDSFSGSNITSITKRTVDNDTGTIYFNISINLYFRENDGLESTSPELTFNNVAINGWRTNPFIVLNNRVDVSTYEQNYASEFAGNAIKSDAQITTLLQDRNFLNLICLNTQGLANNSFSASGIKIDNLKGEIKFDMGVNGGQFHPNQNIVTLYGFRPTITLKDWISQISNLKGTSTTRAAIEQDVLDQVWKSANNSLSPFGNTIDKSDISVLFDSYSLITIKFNTINFIDNSANIVDTPTDITFDVNYGILAPSNLANNDWIYIVIFSITGVGGLIFLIWLIYVIIKKSKDKWFK